jgi:hypothetical protein
MSQLSLQLPTENTPAESNLVCFSVVIPPLEGDFLYACDRLQQPELAVGDVVKVFCEGSIRAPCIRFFR